MKYYHLESDKILAWVLSLGIRSQLLGLSSPLGSHGSIKSAFRLWLPCFLFSLNSQLLSVFIKAILEMLVTVDETRDIHILLQGPDLTAFSGLWLRLMNICRKHSALVTQLQGENVKQITLIFSRFLVSPLCQKTNLVASCVSNHCVYGMWNISNLWRQAQLHILYKHTHTNTMWK